MLFANTESISKTNKLTAKAGEDLSAYSTDDMDPKMIALDNKMKGLAIQRQKRGRFLKLTSWALYHRSTLKDLLEQIASLLDEIERLFPAPQARTTLVQQEAAAIGDKQALKLLEVIAGHQYSNIGIKEQAHTGDECSSDWSKSTIRASHNYDSIEVEEGGKALIGNKYGRKDFYD